MAQNHPPQSDHDRTSKCDCKCFPCRSGNHCHNGLCRL